MSSRLIVDGYNLGRSGDVMLDADPATSDGRRELCALLASFAMEKRLRLTVVFDGRGAEKAERSKESFKGGTSVYSSRHETADDVIRELARNAPAGTIVVTSDRGLAGTLPSRNILTVSCEEFASLLYDRQLAELKGGAEEDKGKTLSAGARRKKGEGHRPKKQDRKRERLLRKF